MRTSNAEHERRCRIFSNAVAWQLGMDAAAKYPEDSKRGTTWKKAARKHLNQVRALVKYGRPAKVSK